MSNGFGLPYYLEERPVLNQFPAFLKWLISEKDELDFSLQDDLAYWKDIYSRVVDNFALAEFGANMTVLLWYLLAYDEARGLISDAEYMQRFSDWQQMIPTVLRLCDPYEEVPEVICFKQFEV